MYKKKLKIFTASFPYGKGEQFFEEELEYLKNDFDIILQPYYYGHSRICRIHDKSISINTPLLGKINVINMIRNYKLLFYFIKNIAIIINSKDNNKRLQILELLRAIYGLFNLKIEKECKDYYFYWGIDSAYYIPIIKKYNKNIKIYCRYHGSDLYEELHGGKIPLRKEVLLNCDYNIAISEYGRKYIKNKYGLNSICIKVGCRNNKGTGRPSYDHKFRIVSCSNINNIKRVDYIADILCSLNFPFEWHHFGDGHERKKVEEIINNCKKKKYCFIHGFVKNEKIIDFYINEPNDIFINLSISEGIPVSIMEAQSCGIPAIALNVGGLSEIIMPELLINIDKREEILRIINRFYNNWIKNPEYLRDNARKIWEENYNIEKNYQKLKELFS